MSDEVDAYFLLAACERRAKEQAAELATLNLRYKQQASVKDCHVDRIIALEQELAAVQATLRKALGEE